MQISVLATGSKGNSTYISTNNHKILIDLGTSSLYVENKLKELGVSPRDIDSIFLTHTHADHINGLKVFIKKYNPVIFLTSKMYKEIRKNIPLSNYYFIEEDTVIDDLKVRVFKTSHDVDDSNGYIFESDNKSIVYVTDTGYINNKYHNLLKNRDFYVMESNHDIRMLMDGKYPYYLKQRVVGDRGHLSNKDSSKYLSEFVGDRTKGIVLIHLSEENNNKDIAYNTLIDALEKKNKHVDKILISEQKECTEMITI